MNKAVINVVSIIPATGWWAHYECGEPLAIAAWGLLADGRVVPLCPDLELGALDEVPLVYNGHPLARYGYSTVPI